MLNVIIDFFRKAQKEISTPSLAHTTWQELRESAKAYVGSSASFIWPNGDKVRVDRAAKDYKTHILKKGSILKALASITELDEFLDAGLIKTYPSLEDMIASDLLAIRAKDPAAQSLIDPFLNYKGFHAVAIYRVSHVLWNAGLYWNEKGNPERAQRFFANALRLQSINSKQNDVDIHPAARIGESFFIDHAHGVVIGETAVIGKNVSFLHGVTIGGTGNQSGNRHANIGPNVTIGANATILGNIIVEDGATIGACAVVTKPVRAGETIVGLNHRIGSKRGTVPPPQPVTSAPAA